MAGSETNVPNKKTPALEKSWKNKQAINTLDDLFPTNDLYQQLQNCNKILDVDPYDEKILGRRIKVLCRLGKFDTALSFAVQWAKSNPDSLKAQTKVKRIRNVIATSQEQDIDDDDDDDDVLSDAMNTNLDSHPKRLSPEGEERKDPFHSPLSSTLCLPTAAGTRQLADSTDNVSSSSHSSYCTSEDSSQSSRDTMEESLYQCQVCDIEFRKLSEFEHHCQCDVHKKRLSSTEGANWSCSFCDVTFRNQAELENHCRGDLHKKSITSDESREWKFRPPPRSLRAEEFSMCIRFLETGKCSYSENCTQAHSREEWQEWKDRFEFKKQSLQKAREKRLHGSSYTEKLAEKLLFAENPDSLLVNNLDYVKLHINSDLRVNMSNKKCTNSWTFTVTSKVCLHRVILLDDSSRLFFRISSISVGPRKSQKHQNIENPCQEWVNYEAYQMKNISSANAVENVYRIKVVFKTNIYGTFRQSIVFDFGTEPLLSREMHVESAPIQEADKLSKDLMCFDANRWTDINTEIIKFEPNPLALSDKEEILLEEYPLPDPNKLQMQEVISQTFGRENYRRWMHDLLYFEELTQFGLISRFNVKVTLQIVDRFMLVPGGFRLAKYSSDGQLFARMKLENELSEDTMHGRLVLQSANTVLFAPDNNSSDSDSFRNEIDKVYEAIIEDKGKDFVFFRLSSKCVTDLQLKPDQELPVHVQFQLNRQPKVEMHAAIDNLPDLDIVFPTMSNVPDRPWQINPCLESLLDQRVNEKQLQAIAGIIAEPSGVRLPPLLLLGPYGTGKTFTLAQAAKLALQKQGTRIMICTHSNSAADLYIKEFFDPYVMSGHQEARPLRIYFRKRWVQTVHSAVIKYSLLQPDSTFRDPTVEDLEKHRVIVTTLNQSRTIYDLNLGPDFFSHIFLDEAAQVMETESLIPLGLAGVNTKVVLAGDHMQMSPEIYADFARQRNFHRSLLERLYEAYPVDSPCRIMLHENYRSTKELVKYTSSLFYDNKLIAAGQECRHPNYWPFTFFTAKGEEVQHQNSTGFYNIAEVYEVTERVVELVKNWPSEWEPFNENSIGVVTPYGDQVQKIRAELRKRDLGGVSVERVVNVQGKQFRVIVLSTVRTRHTCSTEGHMDMMDYGFLSNVKLLNTAITRAQSLVAVIGDPVSLCLVGKCRKIWEHLLEAATKNGSLIGMTWTQLRGQLDGAEIKKTYVLNPLAPEFVPSRQFRSHIMDDEHFEGNLMNPYGHIKVPAFPTLPFYSRCPYPLYPQMCPPYLPFYTGPYYGIYAPVYSGSPHGPGTAGQSPSISGRSTPPIPLPQRHHTASPLHGSPLAPPSQQQSQQQQPTTLQQQQQQHQQQQQQQQRLPKVKPLPTTANIANTTATTTAGAIVLPQANAAPLTDPGAIGEVKNAEQTKILAKTAKLTKGQPLMYMPPNPYHSSILPFCLPFQHLYSPEDHRMLMVPPRFPSNPYLGSPAFMSSSKYYGMSRPSHYRNGTFPGNNRAPPTSQNARIERAPPSMRDPQVPPPPSSSSPSSTATGQVIQLLPNVKHVPSYLLTSHQLGSSTESSRTNTPISTNISEDLPMHLKPEIPIDHLPIDSRSGTPIEHSWSQMGRHKKAQNGDLHRHILKKSNESHTDDLVKSLSLRQMMNQEKLRENEGSSLFHPVSKFGGHVIDGEHIVKPSPMRTVQTLGCQFGPPPLPPAPLPTHSLNQPHPNMNPPAPLPTHSLNQPHPNMNPPAGLGLSPNPLNHPSLGQPPPNLNPGPPSSIGQPLRNLNPNLAPPNHFECISPMNPSMGYKPVVDEPLRKKNLPKLDLPLRKPSEEENPNHLGRHNGLKDFPSMHLGTGFGRQFSEDIETPTTVLNLVKMLDESPEKDVEQEAHDLTGRHPSVASNFSVSLGMDPHLEFQRHVAKTGHMQATPSEMKLHSNSGNLTNFGGHVLEREPQHPTSLMWPMRPRLYDRSVLSTTDEPPRFIEPLTPRTPAGYGSLGDADLDSLSFLRDLKIGDTPELQDSLY